MERQNWEPLEEWCRVAELQNGMLWDSSTVPITVLCIGRERYKGGITRQYERTHR